MVTVNRYSPGYRQKAHDHDGAHVSLVLAGGHEEDAGRHQVSFDTGRLALRPDGMRHACQFSRHGALILTCSFAVHASAIQQPSWSRPLPFHRLRALTPLLLSGEADATEAAWDLIALSEFDEQQRAPSRWIRTIRDQLIEEPTGADISTIAEKAGRHRVHVGRAFLAAFGETPSAFRRRVMVSRALCAAARDTPVASAAALAGFSDQSHFSRACRAVFGLTPGQITRSANDVAFVQYFHG
jgi:AraC family transcriptional regulator